MARDYKAWLGFLAEHRATPFAWGSNDCVLFAAASSKALTGRDLLTGIAAQWSTQEEADAALEAAGGLEAAVSRMCPSVPPAQAMRGDLGMIALPEGRSALMVIEGTTLVGPGPRGLKRVSRTAMLKAWSVGG